MQDKAVSRLISKKILLSDAELTVLLSSLVSQR